MKKSVTRYGICAAIMVAVLFCLSTGKEIQVSAANKAGRFQEPQKTIYMFDPAAYKIENFPMILQLPELPTGCEVTALTMVLHYYGYEAGKVEMAMDYLPRTSISYSSDGQGRTVGPDMDKYFVGDPSGEGIICGNIAIETAANKYLAKVGSKHTAKAIKGISTEELFGYIAQGTPAVIWCTIGMGNREETMGWYTEDGRYMEWSHNDHGAVLIGYDAEKVYIADPICDMISCSIDQFERIFTARGRQCVILIDKAEGLTGTAAETESATESALETEVTTGAAAETEVTTGAAAETESATESALETEVTTGGAAETEVTTGAAVETERVTESALETEVTTGAAVETESTTEAVMETEVSESRLIVRRKRSISIKRRPYQQNR